MGKIDEILDENKTAIDIKNFLDRLVDLLGSSSKSNNKSSNINTGIEKISFFSCLLSRLRRILKMFCL